LHVPYHDEEAIGLAIAYGKERKADAVIINGDMADFFALSKWEKDPRKRDLAGEVAAGRDMLQMLRDSFPKAKIVWKEGNHEERWERYLQTKAADLLGLPEFSWANVYGLAERHVQHVGECRPLKLGKMTVIHGHEYRFSISNPVNPARGLFNRGKIHALCGHFHQPSNHAERRLDGKVVATWSTGCLCDLHPDYAPINNWSHGFAFVELASNGAFEVWNPRIIEGKVYT
jgi:predicted phosphodiesterase